MERETYNDIDWHPGQVEQSRWSAAGEKAANLIKIAERLQPFARASGLEWLADQRVEHAAAQAVIEGAANPAEHASPDEIQNSHKGKQHGCEDNEADKRRDASARDDT